MTFVVETLGLSPDLVDYESALATQYRYHDEVVAGERPSTLLVLEHEAVYTAGKRTEDFERPRDGTPVVDVDRGGKITWHGPGQLVVYPIYKLNDKHSVKLYVSQLEQAAINIAQSYGVDATRVEGRSGVWVLGEGLVPDRKIAAIGIRIHDGVAMHGMAVNCSNDQGGFGNIIPCGIADAAVSSLSQETGRTIEPAVIAPALIEQLNTLITA